MFERTFRLAAVAVILATTTASAAQTLDPREALRALIWQKELANYAGRATESGLKSYIDSIGEDYLVWPPGRPAPLHPAELKAQNAAAAKGNKEQLTLTLTDFTMHDGTAIIFYSSHKTMTATGETVDERYDTIHVWSRYGTDWKLIGGLARRAS
jgi:ketosteroid isomerase-like protein